MLLCSAIRYIFPPSTGMPFDRADKRIIPCLDGDEIKIERPAGIHFDGAEIGGFYLTVIMSGNPYFKAFH